MSAGAKRKAVGVLVATYVVLWCLLLHSSDVAGPNQHRNQPEERVLVFVGGLQRSGTTSAAEAVVLALGPGVASQQEVANLRNASHLERVRRWRGQSKSYFQDAVRSGGLEGKFLQNVYPYRYALRDWGAGGDEAVRRLASDADAAADESSARRLWAQWRLFWNVSRPVLVEKTPENVLMAPFLQATFRPDRLFFFDDDDESSSSVVFAFPAVAFVFVLRHPLAWSLSIEKWLVNKWNRRKTAHLQSSLAARFDMWLLVAHRLLDHDAPGLARLAVFHAEVADLSPRLPGHLLAQLRLPSSESSPRNAFRGYNAANLAYVACWLDGGRWLKRRCVFPAEETTQRRAELASLRRLYESRLLALGYGLPNFAALLCSDRCSPPPGNVSAVFSDASLRLDAIAPRYRSYFAAGLRAVHQN